MQNKTSFLTLVLLGTLFMPGLQAHASYKNFQPYVAVSGGTEHLSGKRNDSITEDDGAGVAVTTILSNAKKMSNDNIALSFLGGFTWKPTALPIAFGPEIYIGRGAVRSKLTDVREDLVPQNRYYTAELNRQFNYGIVARAGYQCHNYFLSLAVGYDRGRFKLNRALTYDPTNVSTVKKNRSKTLSGLVLGAGVEKKIQNFSIGIDFRYTKYAKFSANHTFDAGAGLIPGTLDFSARPKIYATTLRLSYQF